MDVDLLAQHLAALPEVAMRRAKLADLFATLPMAEVVSLCATVAERARDGAPFDIALAALTSLLEAETLGYDFTGALYLAAREAQQSVVTRLLLSPSPPPDGAPSLPVQLRDRPLGMRKFMARGRKRDTLVLLLHDPDTSVLEILLRNPRLVERDIVRLAARRPTTALVQRTIFGSERFSTRLEVRRALVKNPYTPSDLGARLVGLLPLADVRDVVGDARLDAVVREAAQHLLSLQRQ